MLVGFHVEGNDYLIFRALLAKLLDFPEELIDIDSIDKPGRGWQFVLDELHVVLHRFYHKCARFVVVGMDNDGNLNFLTPGSTKKEDPHHCRHWLHEVNVPNKECRYCQLRQKVEATRPQLNWIPKKPGTSWPILVAVPTEMIESWLLIILALLEPGKGSLYAENESRQRQKQDFYRKPEPTRNDIEMIALPLIRKLETSHIDSLRNHSKSFSLFAEQVMSQRDTLLQNQDCW
jgi:hypothetical protein